MIDPLFWLGLSVLLVAVSLTAVLVALLPTLQELARAARSAEKLFDTLSRELPPTLESIRLTGLELTDLTDDVGQGVQSAGRVVKQVDQSLSGVRQQAKKVQKTTRSVMIGVRAAWQSLTQAPPAKRTDRLAARSASAKDFEAPHYSNYAAENYAVDLDESETLTEALQNQPLYRSANDTEADLRPEEPINQNRSLPTASKLGDRRTQLPTINSSGTPSGKIDQP